MFVVLKLDTYQGEDAPLGSSSYSVEDIFGPFPTRAEADAYKNLQEQVDGGTFTEYRVDTLHPPR